MPTSPEVPENLNSQSDAKKASQNNGWRKVFGPFLINSFAELGLGGAYAFDALIGWQNPFKAFGDGVSLSADEITSLGEEAFIGWIDVLLQGGDSEPKLRKLDFKPLLRKLEFKPLGKRGAWAALALDGVDGARAKSPKGGILYQLFGERFTDTSQDTERSRFSFKRLPVNPNGQLVDVGSDRRREYNALIAIDSKLNKGSDDVVKSVALPSLMRALAEGLGFYVPESSLDPQIAKMLLDSDEEVDYKAGTGLGRNKLIIDAAYLAGQKKNNYAELNLDEILQSNLQTAHLRANPRLWRQLPENGREHIRKEGIKRFLFLTWQMNRLVDKNKENIWLDWAKRQIPELKGILEKNDYLSKLIQGTKDIDSQEKFFEHLNKLNINLDKIDNISRELKPKESKKSQQDGKDVWLWDLDNTAASFPVVGGPPSVGKISKLLRDRLLGRKDIDEILETEVQEIEQQIKEFEFQDTILPDQDKSAKASIVDKLKYQIRRLNPGVLALMVRLAQQRDVYQAIASGRSGSDPESVRKVTEGISNEIFPLLDEEFTPKPEGLSSAAWKSIQITTAINNGATHVNLVENDLDTALSLAEKFKAENVTIHLRKTLETTRVLFRMLNIKDLPDNIKLFNNFSEIEINKTGKSMQELMIDENGEPLLKYFDAKAVIGYGSAFKKQQNHQATMQDMVVVVDDVERWHKDNVARFPEMFNTFFPNLPFRDRAKYLTKINKKGARINYYHVHGAGTPYKIGVISKQDYLDDLKNWTNFYMAGRAQKPIFMHADEETKTEIENALKTNRKQAVNAALLLLPILFKRDELMLTILSLSYMGDSRKKIGLDANKAAKIYDPNKDEILEMYKDIVEEVFREFNIQSISIFGNKFFTNNKDKGYLKKVYSQLPKGLQELKFDKVPDFHIKTSIYDFSSWYRVYSSRIKGQLSYINSKASKAQTKKGLQTTGFVNSFKYVWAKIKKALKRKRKA